MKISVVIPFFNESSHISKLLRELTVYKVNVVVVDDGSTDSGNKKVLNPGVILLTHKVNLGKGAAMKTGAEYAYTHGADAVIFMDSDGQHSPNNLQGFIQKLNSGNYDVVFGSRNLSSGMPFVRHLGNRIASFVINSFFGVYVSDPICGFRAITKHAYDLISWESTGYGVESEILAKVAIQKLRFIEVPVETIYHDKDKGVTVLDAFGVFADVIKWKLTK